MSIDLTLPVLKPADFASDQDVRWCPGCGDYSILAQMKKVLPTLGIPREKIVFISGIGCSSRFPYYMNTYGIHSIHGRAPAVATGLKSVRPDLQRVGHHRRRRRPVDRRQSPDARHPPQPRHQHRPVQQPHLRPDQGPVLAHLAAGQEDQEHADGRDRQSAAPAVDRHRLRGDVRRPLRSTSNIKHLGEVLKRAAEHPGTAFVEVYQNCNVFNDGAWDYATDRDTKADTTLELEHGKPLIFGKNRDKGIRLNGMDPEVVELGKGITRRRSAVPRREGRRAEPGLPAQPHALRRRLPRADRRVPRRRRARGTTR